MRDGEWSWFMGRASFLFRSPEIKALQKALETVPTWRSDIEPVDPRGNSR